MAIYDGMLWHWTGSGDTWAALSGGGRKGRLSPRLRALVADDVRAEKPVEQTFKVTPPECERSLQRVCAASLRSCQPAASFRCRGATP